MDYCPDSWDEPTFTGLATGCPEVCRLHGKEPVKRVAFEGMNTGRRFYMCSVQGYIENCGFQSWLDDEWPQPMKNTLLKLWGISLFLPLTLLPAVPGSKAVVVLGAENLAAAEALGTAGALAGAEALGAAGAALALAGAALAGADAALPLAGAGGALAGAGAGGAGACGAVAGAGAALAGAGGGAGAVLADAEVLPSSVCLVLYKHANKVIILEKQVLYLA
ncbi:hypothetical protein ACQ4PT_037670 [Festuca glaucescens]